MSVDDERRVSSEEEIYVGCRTKDEVSTREIESRSRIELLTKELIFSCSSFTYTNVDFESVNLFNL